jgi:cyclase
MLAKRIIPVLLADGNNLVKGQRMDSRRVVGHVQQAARVHQMRGVDELLILDVSATRENRGPDFEFVSVLTTGCFMPVTVGGGIRTLREIKDLLRVGADKVAICSTAVECPEFVNEASQCLGAQAIVVVIEATSSGQVTSHNGSVLHPELGSVLEYAKCMEEQGAGELIINSVDRDGMMCGYDLDLIQSVAAAVAIPVVACGGAGSYHDMLGAIKAGASAVAAGALFQFLDCTPKNAAKYLADCGLEVRL